MLKFNTIFGSMESDYSNLTYEAHMSQSDEKFSKWEQKKFAERQSVFKKVNTMSEFPQDRLSVWINEQMDILLAKSVVD